LTKAFYHSRIAAFDVDRRNDRLTCGLLVVQGMTVSPVLITDADTGEIYQVKLPPNFENHPYPIQSDRDCILEIYD
jgi:hypothetical protein